MKETPEIKKQIEEARRKRQNKYLKKKKEKRTLKKKKGWNVPNSEKEKHTHKKKKAKFNVVHKRIAGSSQKAAFSAQKKKTTWFANRWRRFFNKE